jgi:hypothetical protein
MTRHTALRGVVYLEFGNPALLDVLVGDGIHHGKAHHEAVHIHITTHAHHHHHREKVCQTGPLHHTTTPPLHHPQRQEEKGREGAHDLMIRIRSYSS